MLFEFRMIYDCIMHDGMLSLVCTFDYALINWLAWSEFSLELPSRAPSTSLTATHAVPFEEDERDHSIWFLDHNYHESMFSMSRRINAKEHVVGWYSTGPKLKENDLSVHGLFSE
ncbi:hypothetical protein SASPL_147761 [Salvia splendens]|uniref:JAB1/MPN/MOV34 metalloenzyme domain-containing protein n=1 Tax=Salvia splendens TaxID=180675 RepID=A0A8X8WEM0_SALSN|nr:hypothetical protein SASPL_147761 [Salvia splendens]